MTSDSTLLQKEENEVSFLKQVHDMPQIEKICFVCTGNTCRSPMAEALFNHFNQDKTKKAISAGLAAYGSPISQNAKIALQKRGILPCAGNHYEHHISRRIDQATVASVNQIIAMTPTHAMALMTAYPQYASKISVMPHEILDPFGGDENVYAQCLAKIEECLKELFHFEDPHTPEKEVNP